MIRYLSGVVLLQIVTLALFWAGLGSDIEQLLIRAILPALLIALVTGFWFASMARVDGERLRADMIERHAAEKETLMQTAEKTRAELQHKAHSDRESLAVQASSDREKLLRQAHEDLLRREKRVSRGANLKVGLAFAAVSSAGVVLLLTQLLTLGLLTITAAGGALGGYLFRWKQTRDLPRLINAGQGSESSAELGRDHRDTGINADVIEVLPAPSKPSGPSS